MHPNFGIDPRVILVPQNAIAAALPLLLGMGVLMLGAGLQGTLLGLRATLEDFPTPVIGIVMSCYYVGYLLGTAAAPRLIKRVGHIRVFAGLAAIASGSSLVQAIFVHPAVWGAMRLVSGLCFAGIYVVAESWLNARATAANRGRLLAVYMLTLYIGLGSAQFLLTIADPGTATPFMLVSVLISLAMVPIVASAQQAPDVATPQKVRYRDLYRDSAVGVVAVTVSGMISSTIFSMGPVYARLSGLGTTGVATFMAASILAAVLTQYPVGRLSDRIDRRTVIAVICAIATIVASCIVIFGNVLTRGVFLGLTACFGGLVLTLYSLAVSHVNDKLDSAQMVAASSALLRLNGSAAAIGPALTGALIAAFGPTAYFSTLATLTGALTIYNLWRKTRRRAIPGAQKGPFITAEPQGITGQITAGAEERSAAAQPASVVRGGAEIKAPLADAR
jgi:MFS family permease